MKTRNEPTPSAQNGRCQDQGEIPAGFCEKLTSALTQLKEKLQQRYEVSFPSYGEQIRSALAEAEELAWETAFPQLFLPELAEVRIAQLAYAYAEPSFRNIR